jgi:hypothetical protein
MQERMQKMAVVLPIRLLRGLQLWQRIKKEKKENKRVIPD